MMHKLFNDRKIYDLAIGVNSSIENRIKKMNKSDFENSSVDELAEGLYNTNQMTIPKIKEADICQKKPEDTKIKIRTSQYGGSRSIDGTKYTLIIPFNGDSSMFGIFPTSYTHRLPYGNVYSDEIHVVYEVPTGRDASSIRPDFDSNLELIKKYLGNLKNDVEQFNGKLLAGIKASLERRKNKLDEDDETASSFGFPIK